MQFNPGDTVRLKSGGPVMTVSKLINNFVHCTWFDEKHKLQSGSFTPEQLVADDGTPVLPILIR